jgi:hypothetical protein
LVEIIIGSVINGWTEQGGRNDKEPVFWKVVRALCGVYSAEAVRDKVGEESDE